MTDILLEERAIKLPWISLECLGEFASLHARLEGRRREQMWVGSNCA